VSRRRPATGAAVAGVLVAALLAGAAGCTGERAAPAPSPPAGSGAAPAPEFAPGAPGAGDPYFPSAGNGGYDVVHYDLAVSYTPATDELAGEATLTATATADLSRFNLDLSALTVGAVTVDGAAAGFAHDGGELVVTPAAGLPSGARFTVSVRYGGVPRPATHPRLGSDGFHHTGDGAFALGQPQSAATWFPVNDHPLDKATYAIAVTVPEGLAAISNGLPAGRSTAAGRTTWSWRMPTPMASYLAVLAIGDYRVHTGEHDGRPVVIAVHDSLPAGVDEQLESTPRIADFLATQFGPYPFGAYGGIALADSRIRFALETQSRPIYGPSFFADGRDGTWVIVHELAHQWFGDSVSVHHWDDIWLNEGFATYAEWLWEEHAGGRPVAELFDAAYDGGTDNFWSVPPGDPGPDSLFHAAVYRRGAMTLHALRMAVGDVAFFRILRGWAADNRDGNADTARFIAHCERVSGARLGDLFDAWLYEPGRPARP
jgi:aminopeptidase N